jgi:hypothetical protein
METLSKHMIDFAKKKGYNQIICFTKDENTIVRSVRLGFQDVSHVTLALNLRKVA